MAALVSCLLVVGVAGAQAAEHTPQPRVNTGGVEHAHGTTVQLDGVVNPNGVESSYFFRYGPTVAYGTQTKPIPIGKGLKPVKVGQVVTGIFIGYHYQLVALYVNHEGKTLIVPGKDRSYTGRKTSKLRFQIPKGHENQISVAYGSTAEIAGSLTGLGNALHALTLQSTPFPYTESFTGLGVRTNSSRTGSFLFKVPRMTQSTEFRVLTADLRPLYSPLITVHVYPRIVLHVRSAGGSGLYRFFGTITPARTGARVIVIQQLLPQKANSKREGPRGHTVGSGAVYRATGKLSRFSVVVHLSGNYRYRASLSVPKGPLSSGTSSNVLVKAPKGTAKGKHKHTKSGK